ncbi:hypothetical protein BB558_001114 [Smittium angustum]|uniref:Neurochondrin n=1 Tax=Smittium angustum TaxID=133377 RepID=A0A2U1JCA9_SMIAN|nr:hypothetical protein BB558_001114 [Smittium angustum]
MYAPTIELLKCTKLLSRKTTDDEKIAGLTVLPYLLQNDVEEAYQYVFNRMDWRFIKRLLTTGISKLSKAKESVNETNISESTDYIQLALYITATFVCRGPEFAQNIRIISLLPSICKAGALGKYEYTEIAIQNFLGIVTGDNYSLVFSEIDSWLGDSIELLKNAQEIEIYGQFLDTMFGLLVHSYNFNKEEVDAAEYNKDRENINTGFDLVPFRILYRLSKHFQNSTSQSKLLILEKLAKNLNAINPENGLLADVSKPQNKNLYFEKEAVLIKSSVNQIIETCMPILQQKSDDIKYKMFCIEICTGIVENWSGIIFETRNSELSLNQNENFKELLDDTDLINNQNFYKNYERFVEVCMRLAIIESNIYLEKYMDIKAKNEEPEKPIEKIKEMENFINEDETDYNILKTCIGFLNSLFLSVVGAFSEQTDINFEEQLAPKNNDAKSKLPEQVKTIEMLSFELVQKLLILIIQQCKELAILLLEFISAVGEKFNEHKDISNINPVIIDVIQLLSLIQTFSQDEPKNKPTVQSTEKHTGIYTNTKLINDMLNFIKLAYFQLCYPKTHPVTNSKTDRDTSKPQENLILLCLHMHKLLDASADLLEFEKEDMPSWKKSENITGINSKLVHDVLKMDTKVINILETSGFQNL